MSEKVKRKRVPLTPAERFIWITAFVICLVIGFLSFNYLLVTGLICHLIIGVLFISMVFVAARDDARRAAAQWNEAEAENARQDEAYTVTNIVDEEALMLDEKRKHNLKNSL